MKASRRRMRRLGAVGHLAPVPVMAPVLVVGLGLVLVLVVVLTGGLVRGSSQDTSAGQPGAGEHFDEEPNDTIETAHLIRPGVWVAGEIGAAHGGPSRRDVDVFSVKGPGGVHHTVRLQSEGATTLGLRDPERGELVRDRGPDLILEAVATGDGTIYVEVGGQTGPYSLCVEATGTTCWEGTVRIAGNDPHARTAELSRQGPARPASAVLAGRAPAELTVAAALASEVRGPLLSRPVVGISQVVALELARLRPGNIIVLGGAESTPDTVVRAASGFVPREPRAPASLEVTVVRGQDPVETAAAAALRFPARGPVAYVIGENDAAGAINAAVLFARTGGPVLVTGEAEVPSETARALARLTPRQVVLVADPSVVSDEVAVQLGRYAGVAAPVPVTRVHGDPRETSVAVAEQIEGEVSEAYLVSLADPAGALAAAVLAARTGAPVLVTGFELTDDVEAALARLRPQAVFIVGGPGVIGPHTEDRVRATLR